MPRAEAVAAQAPAVFSFDTVRERARELAAKDYHPETEPKLPDFLGKLSYDQYHDIRFRPEFSPWHDKGLEFDLLLFHRGYSYKDPVRLHLLEGNQVRDLQFSPRQFDYGKNRFPENVPGDLDYAGFRVVYRASAARKWNEVASFLGASYFRLVGVRQRYGASARGLAIDTAEPSGEEFPRFIEVWIREPGKLADHIEAFALLDSPSAAGACHFVIKPGTTTAAWVECSLFLRKQPARLGVAPLTSMFLKGKNSTRCIPDFRPEVHDSDGLLLHTHSGGWLWRPLVNPEKKHYVSRFPAHDLIGFGLLQRERDFRSYEDLETRYDLHPSLWVQPLDNWATGAVELVEIPASKEYDDNVVAFWVPAQIPVPGQEFRFSYRVSAMSEEPGDPPLLKVRATRIRPGEDKSPPRFVVDFNGANIDTMPPNAHVEARVEATRGKIGNLVVQPNEVTGGWRVFFDLADSGDEPVELRVVLHDGDKVLSESWVYHYAP